MATKDDLVKIRSYVEENLRKTIVSGMPYIDLHDNKSAILTKCNNVIFGRRGSGKSTLLSEVAKCDLKRIEINYEDYKNVSFPNIIIKTIEIIFTELNHKLKSTISIHFIKKRKLRNRFKKELSRLKELYDEDDSYLMNITSRTKDSNTTKGAFQIEATPVKGRIGSDASEESEQTIVREKQFAKLEKLKRNLVDYKELFKETIYFVFPNDYLYLLLDDFYFIEIDNQPYLADVIHVLIKNTKAFMKLASIKHRTKIYLKDERTYQGVEIGHDANEIDLDYSLEDMDELMQFYTQLLAEISKIVKASVRIEDLFGGAGFKQLCIASGGITRDFLILFSKCLNEMIVDPESKIGKELVNGQAASYMVHKLQSLTDDVKKNSEMLEKVLNYLKEEILVKKKTNCFLISKDDLDRHPHEKNVIRDLFDMRLIHLIDKNTSCAPSDGKQYEAYLLDVGLYDFTRLRNFEQIEPGNKDDKSRKDKMRASPRINIDAMIGIIQQL